MTDESLKTKPVLVAGPRDFFLAPIFAATKQTGPREVLVGRRRYQIGGFNPLDPSRVRPALDVRHLRIVFSFLLFRDPQNRRRLVNFSFSELCRTYAHSVGGRYLRAIKIVIYDLIDSFFCWEDLDTRERHTLRFIERVHLIEKPIVRKDDSRSGPGPRQLHLDTVQFSPEFWDLIDRIEELQHLRLDVFVSIRSPLAQAIYLYIPSRAVHHDAHKPFEITLTNLLDQVSHPIPKHKSKRKQLFAGNKNSVLSQLDGKETLSGRFRVRLAETADGSDWKLQTWVERAPLPPTRVDSKLTQAFIAGGRSQADLERCLKRRASLDSYETDLLSKAQVKLNGNERFFEKAKALLGQGRFQSILAEAKGDALERRPATKTPTHRLIYRLREAIKGPVGNY